MIFNIIYKYHMRSKQDKHHRFRSWEHCYRYFSANHKYINEADTFDYGCLHLAFYLASWGMLRGSGFLIQKDYRIHKYFLSEIVTNPQYYKYYNREFQLKMNNRNVKGIDELIKETANAYTDNIFQIDGQDKRISVTDTLASKILLGVYGNVPAYDRYFIDGLKLHGINSRFNEQSLLEIIDFYNLNRDNFQKCQQLFNDDGIFYTPMKLIDMYFWQVGFLMDTSDKDSDEFKKIKEIASNFTMISSSPKLNTTILSGKRLCRNNGQTEMIRKHIINMLNQAKAEGHTSVDLKSGDIHKSLKLNNRMPSVCNAMVSLGAYRYKIIHDTPSGASSTRLIRYYLK